MWWMLAGALAGALGGSTVTALEWRLRSGLPLVFDRSRCPSCSTVVRAYDNVPILSFILLGGRCRSCGQRIPLRYPLIEAGGVAIGVLVGGLQLGVVGRLAVLTGLFVGLVASLVDLKEYRIPNRLTYPSALFILLIDLVGGVIFHKPSVVLLPVASMAVVISLYLLLAMVSRGGMGIGDAKLAGVLALSCSALGPFAVFAAQLLAFGFGATFGVGLIVLRRGSLKSRLPFGPFIWLGMLATVAVYAADPRFLQLLN